MKTSKRTNPDFLNGVPELLILQLLARQPMHGYEIVQNIRLRSGAAFSFGEGCIYPVLHRLERQGFLASQRDTVNGRSRVVYRVTPKGSKRLTDSISTWEHVVGAMRLVLEGGRDAQPYVA